MSAETIMEDPVGCQSIVVQSDRFENWWVTCRPSERCQPLNHSASGVGRVELGPAVM